jgi:uncharacterized protein HemX
MEHDTAVHKIVPSEATEVTEVTRTRRWPARVVAFLVVAVLAVGAWQVVDLHRQVSKLQAENQRQQARLESQQNQLEGLGTVASGSATSASVGDLDARVTALGYQLSQDERNAVGLQSSVSDLSSSLSNLSTRVDCVYRALINATVIPNGSLSILSVGLGC